MLHEILRTFGPAPMILGFVLFLVVVFRYRLRLSRPQDEEQHDKTPENLLAPKLIASRIPYIGHVLGFIGGGHDYFSGICSRTILPIFSLKMASVTVSVVKPELTRRLPKSQHLSLNPLVLKLLKRSLDLGKASCSLLSEEDEMSRKFAPAISRLFRDEFIPNRSLGKYVTELDGYIKDEVMAIEDRQTIQLEDWIFKTLVGALGKSIWGGCSGPFGDDEFLGHLRTFLMNLKSLNAPFNFMIDQKILESRCFVRDSLEKFSFEEYKKKCSKEDAESADETFLGRIRLLCLEHGAAAEGWTDYQLLLIAGLGPNVMAASTWMFHHLLSRPDLLEKVRLELSEASKSSNESIDISRISELCPLLQATWYEVLRYHGGFSLGRYVHEDSSLAGEYLLRKGTYVLAPLKPHHFDHQVWGPTAEEFCPERFLKEDGSIDEMRRRSLRVFGMFGTMCPGRYLAVHMAMSLTARLLLSFDLSPLDSGLKLPPDESKDIVAGLPTPAWDVRVEMRKRVDVTDRLKIYYKDER